MAWWMVGAVANGVMMIAYLGICMAILRPLLQEQQLLSNRLGAASAAIFLTSAIHHGALALKAFLPWPLLGLATGASTRLGWDWEAVAIDLVAAAAAVYYLTMRRTYGSLMRGAKLFEDIKERQRQALEINDNIVQGLAVAQLALALDDRERSQEALENTLLKARSIITELLGETSSEVRLGPGDLRRRMAAEIANGESRSPAG